MAVDWQYEINSTKFPIWLVYIILIYLFILFIYFFFYTHFLFINNLTKSCNSQTNISLKWNIFPLKKKDQSTNRI